MRRDLIPFSGRNLDLRRPFENLFRIMDDTMSGLDQMAVDIYEEDNNVVVKADLPGFSKDEIKVDVEDDTLFLQAQSQGNEEVENKKYFRRERGAAVFREVITLPAEVDKENASAKMENGVLEIRMPKIAPAKDTRRIEIQ